MRDAYLCVTSAKGVAVIMTPVPKKLKRTFFFLFSSRRSIGCGYAYYVLLLYIPLPSFDRSAASPPPLALSPGHEEWNAFLRPCLALGGIASTTIYYCPGSLPPPPLFLDRDGGREGKKNIWEHHML